MYGKQLFGGEQHDRAVHQGLAVIKLAIDARTFTPRTGRGQNLHQALFAPLAQVKKEPFCVRLLTARVTGRALDQFLLYLK